MLFPINTKIAVQILELHLNEGEGSKHKSLAPESAHWPLLFLGCQRFMDSTERGTDSVDGEYKGDFKKIAHICKNRNEKSKLAFSL